MKSMSYFDEDHRLTDLIRQTNIALERARGLELGYYGMTVEQARMLLIIIVLGDKATPTNIARYIFRQPHSMSAMLSRMEQSGLIKKERIAGKGNVVNIELTQKGKKMYKLAKKREASHAMMTVLTKDQKKLIGDTLEILLTRAKKEIVEIQSRFVITKIEREV